MKTKFLMLAAMIIIAIGKTFAQANSTGTSGMNSFSSSEYLLMSLCAIMLAVIFVLARVIRQLSDQMR